MAILQRRMQRRPGIGERAIGFGKTAVKTGRGAYRFGRRMLAEREGKMDWEPNEMADDSRVTTTSAKEQLKKTRAKNFGKLMERIDEERMEEFQQIIMVALKENWPEPRTRAVLHDFFSKNERAQAIVQMNVETVIRTPRDTLKQMLQEE